MNSVCTLCVVCKATAEALILTILQAAQAHSDLHGMTSPTYSIANPVTKILRQAVKL